MRTVAIVNQRNPWPSGLPVEVGERVAYVIFPDVNEDIPQQIDMVVSGLRSGLFGLRDVEGLNGQTMVELCNKLHRQSRSPEELQEEQALRAKMERMNAQQQKAEATAS